MSIAPQPRVRADQNAAGKPCDRRQFGRLVVGALAAYSTPGCSSDPANMGKLEKVWGRAGMIDGRFHKPRAMAIDGHDQLYIVDKLARIQVFDREGQFLRGWRTPLHEAGKPTGLTISHDGMLLVADTHYYRVLTYTPQGELIQDATIGGTYGPGPGEFGLVTDAVRDAEGCWYVAEYGEFDRIQKLSPAGKFLLQWGGHGSGDGEFLRPQNIVLDDQQRLWVADACNHRIQVFDTDGKLIDVWGEQGTELGQLHYPYDLVFDGEDHIYISEFGNNRVQKLTLDGKPIGAWGRNGRRPGELDNPWALVYDSQGRIHVLDTNNHRVQRITM